MGTFEFYPARPRKILVLLAHIDGEVSYGTASHRDLRETSINPTQAAASDSGGIDTPWGPRVATSLGDQIWYGKSPSWDVPSGKPTVCYGKSPWNSWVNQLFRLGHGFQFANCKRLPESSSFCGGSCGYQPLDFVGYAHTAFLPSGSVAQPSAFKEAPSSGRWPPVMPQANWISTHFLGAINHL